ncbi:Late embryogenesis abundant protein, partial [Quillaja saponaria]
FHKMTFLKMDKSQCSIYLWFLQVVIVLVLISVVIWLCLTPKSPNYTISNAYIPALDTRNFTLHHNHIVRNTSIVFNLGISNPNKGMGIYFDDSYITLHHNATTIGSMTLMGFYQGHKQNDTFEVLLNAGNRFWERIVTWPMDLRVCLKTLVRYEIFGHKTRHHLMKLEANIHIGSDGFISGDMNVKLHQYKLRKSD